MAAPAVPTVGTVPRVRLPKPRLWRASHAFRCQRASLGTMSIDAPVAAPHSDDYVFLRGVAVIDDTRAGYLGVVESD